jgi:hypothetical protein
MWKSSLLGTTRRRFALATLAVLGGFLFLWLAFVGHRHFTATPRPDTAPVAASSSKEVHAELDGADATSLPTAQDTARQEIHVPGDEATSKASLLVRVLMVGSKQPVPGGIVRVLVRPKEDADKPVIYAEGATTDSGTVELPAPPEVSVSLSVRSKADWNSLVGDDPIFVSPRDRNVKPLATGEHREITIEVYYGRDIDFWGRVVSAEDGLPIKGVRVERLHRIVFSDLREHTKAANESLTSDDRGLFEIRTASWMLIRGMRLTSEGTGSGLFEVEAGHETPDKALLLKLHRSATIQAHVFDSRPGPEPIQVHVSVPYYEMSVAEASSVSSELFGKECDNWHEVCDAGGRCTIHGLPSGAPLLAKILRGQKVVLEIPDVPPLDPGEERAVEWRIGGGAVVHGRVVDQRGEPVAGRELWLLQRVISVTEKEVEPTYLILSDRESVIARATTDESGGFRFNDVASGHWWLGVAPESGGEHIPAERDVAPIATELDITSSEIDHPIDLKAFLGIVIQGTVQQPDGSPARQSQVEARLGKYVAVASVATNDQGGFSLGPLGPGELTVEASMHGEYVASDPVVARAGDTGLVLHLKAGGSLSVTILDRTSRSQVQGTLYVSNHSQNADPEVGFLSGKGDRFRFDGMVPGVYDLVAVTNAGAIGVARGVLVEAGTKPVEVVVETEPGSRLRLTYEGSDEGAYFTLHSGEAMMGGVNIRRGESATIPVLPGRVRIRDHSVDPPQDHEVVVKAGEECSLVLGNN